MGLLGSDTDDDSYENAVTRGLTDAGSIEQLDDVSGHRSGSSTVECPGCAVELTPEMNYCRDCGEDVRDLC